MKFSILAQAVIFLNAEEATWGSWNSWQDCSKTCSDGTRTRLKACMLLGEPSNDCSGDSSETETCNEGPCPIWSNWSSWSACSAVCDGGIQSRNRDCLGGAEEDCSGPATDEQQCNLQSCAESRPMIYWNGVNSRSRWSQVTELSGEGTFLEQCADYCLNIAGCNGVLVKREEFWWHDDGVHHYCFINRGEFVNGPSCSGSHCYNPEDVSITVQFGVFVDYYKSNPAYLPTNEPDGTIGVNDVKVKGVCDETSTAFGTVNYRSMEETEFRTADDKNVVRESGSNCAVRCFERAGCTAFFTTDDGCSFIIGYAYGVKTNSEVSEAGKTHTICPNTAYKSTYTLISQFSCIFFAPSEAESIVDGIVERNTGNSDTPLRTWKFTTKSNSPLITSAQYVSIEMLDTTGNDARYRPVGFTIETHVRVGSDASSRRRRRSDDMVLKSPEMFNVMTSEKAAKKAAKEAKKAAKQRQIMPRTEDILAEIAAIEQQATSFILDGNMELPANIKVAATGPIEVVSFIQTAADGTVAADCSSGTCECSAGYIDNGNGCEQMTEEQAATTLAPATLVPTTMAPTTLAPTTLVPTTLALTTTFPITVVSTTAITSVYQLAEFITSLLGKLESVFEVNRPGKPRTHLMTKWKKLESKSIQRYNQMKSNGCQFADSFEFDGIDSDTANVCLDIDRVAAAFVNWSYVFTSDCNKVHKGKELQWHERNHKKINQVLRRTNNRIGC